MKTIITACTGFVVFFSTLLWAGPLHEAVSDFKNELVLQYVKNNDLNELNKYSFTPLMYAVQVNNIEGAEILLTNGADVNFHNKNNRTALYYIWGNNKDCKLVKLLKKYKININNKDIHGFTALHRHVLYTPDFSYGTACLIKFGAKVSERANDGKTPLHLAVKNKSSSKVPIEIAKMLLEHGTDINARDNEQNTPLHLAALSRIFKDHLPIITFLLKNGAEINAVNNNRYTPLHIAAFAINQFCIQLLLENGAQIEAKDIDQRTPLFHSAHNGGLPAVKVFVEHHAKINEQDVYGNTPLYYAIKSNNSAVAAYLIKKGADANLKNKEGVTPADLAHKLKLTEIIKLLNK